MIGSDDEGDEDDGAKARRKTQRKRERLAKWNERKMTKGKATKKEVKGKFPSSPFFDLHEFGIWDSLAVVWRWRWEKKGKEVSNNRRSERREMTKMTT